MKLPQGPTRDWLKRPQTMPWRVYTALLRRVQELMDVALWWSRVSLFWLHLLRFYLFWQQKALWPRHVDIMFGVFLELCGKQRR